MASSTSQPPKSFNAYRMTATLKNLYYKLSPTPSSPAVPTLKSSSEFTKARTTEDLFPSTKPEVDGDDCLHDCESCSVKYPSKFTIDETEQLYGHVKGWSTHLIVGTGKTDWVRDVADEKGSVMEAVGKGKVQPSNGRLMLSASNLPVPDHSDHSTTVLLLPAFQFIDNVTPANTPDLIRNFVDKGPTNTSPLGRSSSTSPASPPTSTSATTSTPTSASTPTNTPSSTSTPPASIPASVSGLTARPCPHKYLILLCSQKTRDARCGQSAPLLRKEFERHLRPLGLYRDLHDERPGGVGIYFISHVGGHKFSANVMIYRRADAAGWSGADSANGHVKVIEEALGKLDVRSGEGKEEEEEVVEEGKGEEDKKGEGEGEAAQCIWLARIRPEDCENVIRYTVLQGKVVKPERQLRGGFDRCKQMVSW